MLLDSASPTVLYIVFDMSSEAALPDGNRRSGSMLEVLREMELSYSVYTGISKPLLIVAFR